MQPDTNFTNLYQAYLGRSRADYAIAMNCGRVYTKNARFYGWQESWRIGRVMTPTLALVVKREKELASFSPQKYYTLKGSFKTGDITFSAVYQPKDNIPVDSEKKITNRSVLELIVNKLKTQDASVASVETKKCIEQPPLPYSLPKLQIEANKKFGLSPKETLDALEKLYLGKLASYPRSDCNYLPTAQHDDAKDILPMLSKYFPAAASADPALKSNAWNDKKITAHYGIIPTSIEPPNLPDDQQKIYNLIAQRYIIQFFPALACLQI